jgi:hypothetical protein
MASQGHYYAAMQKLFNERPPPPTFDVGDVFVDGKLRDDVFMRAYSHVRGDSTPGFPLNYTYQYNEEVPLMLLRDEVEGIMKKWLSISVSDFEDMDNIECLLLGYSMPASCFVKGEPTKKSKIARLIFGLSLIMNVVARIIFGDYLNDVAQTWTTASHKVGMDMYTEDGLNKLSMCFDRLFNNETATQKVFSDDIQGWEFQVRKWMHWSWHAAYMQRANATKFHRRLQTCYVLAERKSLIIDSEGYIHDPGMFIMFSGKPTTHLENSDERAALAKVDNGTFWMDSSTVSTNGDDCLMHRSVDFNEELFSEHLGFVHTDVSLQTPHRINFCSQLFIRNAALHKGMIRVPDGLSKSFFNAVVNDTLESRSGISMHINDHPAALAFRKLVLLCDSA